MAFTIGQSNEIISPMHKRRGLPDLSLVSRQIKHGYEQKEYSRIIVLALLLFLSQRSFTQVKFHPYEEKDFSVAKYEVIDIGFTIKQSLDKPFAVDFGATFVGPNDEEIKVPGFYNGNKQWLLRFSAKDIGQWSFTSYSTITALNLSTTKAAININLLT